MNHSAISYQISVVSYEFKSWLLIIKSDRYDLSYHRIFSMVFKATITIEWNGWGQPLCSMFLRWFLGPTPSSPDGFRWLSTIGQTMRCDGQSFQSTMYSCDIPNSHEEYFSIKYPSFFDMRYSIQRQKNYFRRQLKQTAN